MTFTNEQIDQWIMGIPGYDPYRDAENCYFDYEAAKQVLDFFVLCIKHVDGKMAGLPYIPEDHEKAVLVNLFGWKRADSTRRYREVFYFIARKNSKTTLSAGIALYVLYMDPDPGAQIYSIAAERQQAGICFDIAKRMILADDGLRPLATIYMHSIVVGTKSYKATSAEANTKHGYSPSWVNDDETHAQRNDELIKTMETGMGARQQPCMFHTTTADMERPNSPCNALEDRAVKVRDGIIKDPAFLPVIYRAEQTDDWHDEATWYKANPNLGKSINLDYFRREYLKAKESAAEENIFKRLHLNIRTEQVTRWLQMDKWRACTKADDPVAWRERMERELEGATCEAAIDLGATSDLTALALLFKRDEKYIVLPYFWVPREGALRKEREHNVPYLTWASQGFITLTEGEVTDYDYVLADVLKLASKYTFARERDAREPEIAVDRLFQGAQFCTDLRNEGMDPVEFGQGFLSMAAPTKAFEELVIAGDVDHGANPVLNWMAAGCAVRTDPAGNMKPEKPERHSGIKIDGIVACIMALGRAMARLQQQASVYETRGVLSV